MLDVHGWVTWDKKASDKRARVFQEAWQKLRAHHVQLAGIPSHVAELVGPLGVVVGLVGLVAAGLLLLVSPVGSVAIVVGLIGAWGASSITDRTRRTAIARIDDDRLETWRQVEGLRRFVAEAHDDQIGGMADDRNVQLDNPFLELLPWVIAFGHGDDWADRFDPEIQRATQRRGFYAPVRSGDLSRTRSAAAPQASSSSSGGSFGVGSDGGGVAAARGRCPARVGVARCVPPARGRRTPRCHGYG